MELEAIQKVYRRYAGFYDIYFGPIFSPGRKAVIEQMRCRPGDRVLEVGVGTGLSLPLYPPDVEIVGIDICPEMLTRAQRRKEREGLDNVIALEVMDAENMRFPAESFDKVVAMYVASVVPNPARLVDEMRRVCKRDGELFIVNHFQADNPVIARAERMMAPLSRLFGWHPDFSLPDFVANTDLDVAGRTQVNLFGYWTLLRARTNKYANGKLMLGDYGAEGTHPH